MLNSDYKDMLSCLGAENVEFLIVGAYALAAHGFPRATTDIDLLVRPSPENVERVIRALRRFGSPIADVSVMDLAKGDQVLQLGVEPCRIDILGGIEGVTFDQAWAARVDTQIDGMDVAVLSKGDLLRNKLAISRDKDQGDIAWLRKNQES